MFGRRSLGDFLQGTGLVLIVAQDLQAFNSRRDFLPPRQSNQVRLGHECWNRKKATPKTAKRRKGKYE
jgi:hypothetical protein